MTRFALPALILFAAAFLAFQNGDGDAEYWLLPYVQVLPWVGADLAARGAATWQIILGLGLVSAGTQAWSWRVAVGRRRRWAAHCDELEALRLWTEHHSWAWAYGLSEEVGSVGGETPAHDG